MKILLKYIPESVNRKELKFFVNQAVTPKWLLPFYQRDVASDCRIVRVALKETGGFETHGLVRLAKTKSAKAIIKKLNGSYFAGKKIEARPYIQRSVLRDRRVTTGGSHISTRRDRRLKDRRRPNLLLAGVQNPNIVGMERFRKTYD